MNIEIEDVQSPQSITDVKPGETFIYDGTLWLRTDYLIDGKKSAARMKDGHIKAFLPGAIVTVLNCVIRKSNNTTPP